MGRRGAVRLGREDESGSWACADPSAEPVGVGSGPSVACGGRFPRAQAAPASERADVARAAIGCPQRSGCAAGGPARPGGEECRCYRARRCRPALTSPAPKPVPDWPPLLPLQAIDLRCERGERALFEGFNLHLAAGEIVWLRGANGRGKTTLMRTLAGLGSAAAGELWLGGTALRAIDPRWRRQLLYLGHANALKADLTAAESLHFAARLAGTPCSAGEIAAALEALGVAALARRAVGTMSQGQRRRVALARIALAPRPSLHLLDEPFDALDDDGIERLARLLASVAAAGGAVLFTSHQQVDRLQPLPRVLWLPEAPLPARPPQGTSARSAAPSGVHTAPPAR